jgi:uncharacterized protein (DUF2336 family)
MDTLPQQRVDEFECLATADYDPNRLLDSLIVKLHLQGDAALANSLEVHPKIIAMLRDGKLCISAPLLLMLQWSLDLDDRELRDLIAYAGLQEQSERGAPL